MPQSAALASVLRQPFAEQIDFFRRKINLPTERWDDIWQAAHDRAFVVAGAAKADLLADLRAAVDKGIAQGTTLAEFRRDFGEIVERRGWTGWTGEGSVAGRAWRTRTIYETNLRTSYAAGRHRQLTDPALLAERPYWRYVHSELVRSPRPHHKHWGDARLTLRHDHPFWNTHYPPNGWGCRCRVVAVREPAPGDATAPPEGWDAVSERTGAPVGIDRGWAYAPGSNAAAALLDIVDQKFLRLDAPMGAAMWASLAPSLSLERELKWWDVLAEWQADPLPRGRIAVVGALTPIDLRWLRDSGKPIPASAEIAIRDALPTGVKQARHERAQNALVESDWRALPQWLSAPSAVYYDVGSGKLVFVADGLGPTKIAIEFDPGRLKKSKHDFNLVEAAFRVSDEAIAGAVKGGEWLPVRVPGRRVGVEPT